MSIDKESTIRVEAIKAEQDELKKFKMYMEYLKDKLGRSGAADLLSLDIQNLNSSDLEFYKRTVLFLKSLNEQNCNFEMIKNECIKIAKDSRSLKQHNLSGWIINAMTSLTYIDLLSDSWDGNGDPERSTKKLVQTCLNYTDPENLF
jgi:hypothetical protein